MPTYKISRSLNGDQIVWIARLKKTVIARASSEKELLKLLSERDATIKKRREAGTKKKVTRKKSLSKRLKAAAEAFDKTEEIVEVKKPAPKKPAPKKPAPKKPAPKKPTSKKGKKGFWK